MSSRRDTVSLCCYFSLIWRGYRKTLTFTDVWPLTPENSSKTIVASFEKEWKKELKKMPDLLVFFYFMYACK